MSEFTIGGFAEDLIAKELGKIEEDPSYIAEAVSSEKPQANVPDLRRVEVPNNFMNEILGESTDEVIVQEEEVIEEPSEDLFGKLHSLVRELDSVLNEMTTTGMIGVNMAGPTKKASRPRSGTGGYCTPTPATHTEGASRLLRKLSKGSKTRYKRKGKASPPKGKAKHNPY